jgi:hypothetical protein
MLATALLAAALVMNQCANGVCRPGGPAPEVGYEWRTRPDDPGRSYLYRNGVQVGGYDHGSDVYRAYDAATDAWGAPQAPPWQAEVRNFGVEVEKLNREGTERFRLNGAPASREEVRRVLADQRVPDDAGRLRLTVIGEPAATGRVTDDFARAAALAEWKERVLLQAYLPDHWAVARGGFRTDGRPTIYVQAPDGTVLHRQDDYRDGADGLAQALRKADPLYNPRKDPDLRQRWQRPAINLAALPVPVWLMLVGVAFLVLRRR